MRCPSCKTSRMYEHIEYKEIDDTGSGYEVRYLKCNNCGYTCTKI